MKAKGLRRHDFVCHGVNWFPGIPTLQWQRFSRNFEKIGELEGQGGDLKGQGSDPEGQVGDHERKKTQFYFSLGP